MAYRPAFSIDLPQLISIVIKSTPRNTIDLDINIDKRKFQFTDSISMLLNAPKINAGKAKFPTKIPKPLDSEGVSSLNLKRKKWG